MIGDSDRDLRSKSSETKRSVVERRVFRSEYVGFKELRKSNNLYEVLKVQTFMIAKQSK